MEFSSIIFNEPKFNKKPSAWMEHIPFAFHLVETLKPKIFVELGTHYGNSYFAFCQAIDELKLTTKAYSVDIWMPYDPMVIVGREVFEYAQKINNQNYSHFSNLLKMTFDEAQIYFRLEPLICCISTACTIMFR
jgi:hypothetical protein